MSNAIDLIVSKQAQEQLDKLLKDLQIVNNEIIEINKRQLNFNNSSAPKTISDLKKNTDELIESEKERIKLEERLIKLNTEQAKKNAILKVEIQEKNKLLREEAKEELNLLGAYDKKSKRLNELRKDYKNLIAQEGKATKETKQLKEEIQKLDRELKDIDADVGQFQRNVGNYAKAMSKAGGVVKGAFAGGLIGGAIGSATSKASEFFSISKEAGDNAKTNLAPVLATLQVLLASLVDIIPVLIRDMQVFFKEIQLGIANLPEALGGSKEKAKELTQEIKDLNENFKGKSYSDAFKDFGKRIEDTTKQLRENVEVNRQSELNVLKYSKTIAILTAQEEELRAIADDNNKSFEERAKAFEKARIIADKRANTEILLAKEQLKITEGLVKLQLKQAGVSSDLTNILNDKNRASKVDEETLAKYVETVNAVVEAEGRRNQQTKQDSKEAADIQRDLFEQNLDYALDYTDNQKSINERLIADDRLTLKTRKKILDETNEIFERALEQQVALFEQQTGKKINITDLLNAEDSGVLLETVRALGMGEIETQRLLEVIRDYKTGIQDLNDAQKDLTEAERESVDLKTEIALQQKFINGEIKTQEEFEKALTEAIIENLKKRLETMEEGSVEYLNTLKEINDAILSLKDNESGLGEWLKNYRKGFVDDFIGQSGFDKLFFLIENFDKLKESGTDTALAISEAFQQAFNTISEFSNANFDVQYQNLERQRDISLQFAGESATAREEIERQYEERRRQIQRQQAEAQKRLAIFNIVMNTAQGITAALTSIPPNVPLSIAIGAIGAVQTALVASQPIPAFAEGGTMGHDGVMLVNDAKGSNYRETIETPDGKFIQPNGRNVLMNAKKGTKIYTPEQWDSKLNEMLGDVGIAPVRGVKQNFININNGITKGDMYEIMSKFANKDSYNFSIDEKGIQKTIIRGGQKVNIANKRLKIRKEDV